MLLMCIIKGDESPVYTAHVHVPLKGPKKQGYVSLLGQPIYTQGMVWMVTCPYMTCSTAARSAALRIRSLHVILNQFPGLPCAHVLTDLFMLCVLYYIQRFAGRLRD